MESFFTRYRNEWVLVGILFVQLIALATQVRVPVTAKGAVQASSLPDPTPGNTRLIRVWAEGMVAPFQKLTVHVSHGVRGLWAGYVDLRGVRKENEALRKELTELRFSQAQLEQDALQGRRLQALLDFRKQFIHKTVAAQVIGTSGTELSRVIYIDRGTRDGVAPGMAVVTPDGVVGKVNRADSGTSQVLLISDPQSGAGVLLERLHINGILKGTRGAMPEMQNVMSDEKLQVGDQIVTTGGDRVFPRGLPVGAVESFDKDRDNEPFMKIKVRPTVQLGKLEEVLVITEMKEQPSMAATEENAPPMRAADVLAERLPSVKKKTDAQAKQEEKAAASPGAETVPQGVDTAAVPTDASGKPVANPPAPKKAEEAKKPAAQNPAQDQPR